MKAKLVLTGLVLIAGLAIVNAQNRRISTGPGNGVCRGYACTDSNSNGRCDRYESRAVFGRNKNGGRKGYRSDKRRPREFVDANKNGICDYYESR